MLRLARSFVSTDDSAAEVVQEAWLGVIRGIARFEGRAALKTWVFRILVNTAKSRGVRESRTLPFSSLLPEDEGPSVDPARFRPAADRYPGHWKPGEGPTPWTLPEAAALDGEIRGVIGQALAELPDRHRIVVTLRDVEGYGSEEVCSMLNISPGNQRVSCTGPERPSARAWSGISTPPPKPGTRDDPAATPEPQGPTGVRPERRPAVQTAHDPRRAGPLPAGLALEPGDVLQ